MRFYIVHTSMNRLPVYSRERERSSRVVRVCVCVWICLERYRQGLSGNKRIMIVFLLCNEQAVSSAEKHTSG